MDGNVTAIPTVPDVNCTGSADVTPLPCDTTPTPGWYNVTSCECQSFPSEELSLFDPPGLAFLAVAILSALLDISVVIVFIKFRHTPIVKAANRELSFLLLFVLMICFLFPIIQLGPAAGWRCAAQTFQGPVTTCVYAIFLVKTHRVLSIFEARLPKVVHRQWILGRSLQVVGVFVLTLVQVIISGVCVGVFPPAVVYTVDPVLMLTYADCKSVDLNGIISSAYPMILTVLSLCFAFRARRLPENYGESRHILATMAVCFSVFFICFGLSFLFKGPLRTIVLNIARSFTPLAQLVLLFLPKVYIILVCPERNTVQELRRMTLAHMQRQSEFSPTEGGVRDGDGRRPTRTESRLKSLRSVKSKIHGLPARSDAVRVAAQNGSAARAAGARKKSVQILENGTRSPKKWLRRDAVVSSRRSYSQGLETTDATAVTNVSATDDGMGDPRLPHKHQLRSSMRRQSSGLFVIQFIEETKETESDDDVGKIPAADCPVMFNLRETDSEGEGEGDMFVVSMLGRTLTLTVEDRRPGVPEILGGVYVGSKTVHGTGGTKGSNNQTDQNSLSSLTSNKDSTVEAKDYSPENVSTCVTIKQDPGEGKFLSQGISGTGDDDEGKTVLDIQTALILSRDNDTELTANDLSETRVNSNEDNSIQDTHGGNCTPVLKLRTSASEDSVNNNTCSNTILPLGCSDKNLLDGNTNAVTLASDANPSPSSCLDGGNTEQETMPNSSPVDYLSIPGVGSSQNTDEDAISVCSSSSTSTFCETAADDKRHLLGGKSRDPVKGSAKRVLPHESNPVEMTDICLQMSCI